MIRQAGFGRAIALAMGFLFVASFLFVAMGCESGSPAAAPNGETADDQELIAGSCKVTSEITKKTLTNTNLKALKDPIGQRVLVGGKGCPTGFDEIQQKLRTTDADTSSCKNDDKQPPAGVDTRFVSETAQVTEKADGYRAVVTRSCNGRSNHELLISMFGVQASATKLPQDVELIGFDKSAGVFNYYARENNAWKHFGNSKDFVTSGYDCNADGACVPKIAKTTRCAGCHTGGGLIMKEFDSPWVHWEHFTDTPGVKELMDRFKMTLGSSKTDGLTMEGATRNGNAAWVKARITALKAKGAAELLRPLFCTVEINLQSANSSTFSTPSSVRSDFFVDDRLVSFGSVSIDSKEYEAALTQFDVKVGSLKRKDGAPARDTIFGFTYPQRGIADMAYVDELISQGLIDDDFAKDVLSIDFTRPIFSPVRCNLLKFAPALTGTAITKDAIKKGFATSLAGKTDAGAKELADKIAKTDDSTAHGTAASAFLDACNKRTDKKQLVADIFHYASQIKRKARLLNIMEFSESMQSDNIEKSKKFFDSKTCTLRE
jgi:hypothetical protein